MANREKADNLIRPIILGLVATHVGVALAGALLFAFFYASSHDLLRGALLGLHGLMHWAFFGLLLSQGALLGTWSGLAASLWPLRLFSGVVGTGGLWWAACIVQGGRSMEPRVLLFLGIFVATVALPASILRCFRFRLAAESLRDESWGRFQFSVRDLLLLTVVVACLTAAGKRLLSGASVLPPDAGGLFVSFSPCLGLAIAALWPFHARHPIGPSLTLVFVAPLTSACFAFVFDRSVVDSVTVTGIEALSLAASVLVVRASGCRLIRPPRQ